MTHENSVGRFYATMALVGLVLTCSCASTPPPVAKPPEAVFTNSIGMKLEPIPAGSFLMGSTKAPPSSPVHRVQIDAFWMGQFDVTNKEYDYFKHRPRPPESLTNDQPVTRISYYDAVAFCRWLSKREKRTYRLPTEAEWEYAARGGLEQKDFPWGDDDPSDRATFLDFSSGSATKTTRAGTYPANGYGLYDMAGDVSNWTSDWYYEDYYPHSPLMNPKSPSKPDKGVGGPFVAKVTRGGFFAISDVEVWDRAGYPLDSVPDPKQVHDPDQDDGSGFRVVLEPDINHLN